MDKFIEQMRQRFPLMYENAYDIWVGPGWQHIVSTLSTAIQHYIDGANTRRQWLIDKGHADVPEPIVQVTVAQVKEKYGDLRFYYDGGDDHIAGMVTMAELWASQTCEECGKPGHLRYDLPWHKTLCDIHYAERLVGKGN